MEVNGNGAVFFDYDADGDMDLLLINGSTLVDLRSGGSRTVTLCENDGSARFSDVTDESGLANNGWGMGVCVADYDNDGYLDVYVTAYGSNMLFRNNGNRTFSDVTSHAGIADPSWSAGCAFGDYDRDGYVDLYVANYLDFDEETVPKCGASEFCLFG